MIVSLIWAMADNHVIGIENRLPWKLPADMKWFRKQTMGKPIIMGRLTFESFGAKPLPGRRNIIISRDANYAASTNAGEIEVYTSIESALEVVKDFEEVMIIGGMSLYEQALPLANRLYMTLVHADLEGDAWFPNFDTLDWKQASRTDHDADEKNLYPYSFVILERREKTDMEKMLSDSETNDV
ncbi:type 3 dihydrofolate reductase [Kaarinaea lacus]